MTKMCVYNLYYIIHSAVFLLPHFRANFGNDETHQEQVFDVVGCDSGSIVH